VQDTQDLGMSKWNGMQAFMIEGDQDIRAIRSNESIEDFAGYLHNVW